MPVVDRPAQIARQRDALPQPIGQQQLAPHVDHVPRVPGVAAEGPVVDREVDLGGVGAGDLGREQRRRTPGAAQRVVAQDPGVVLEEPERAGARRARCRRGRSTSRTWRSCLSTRASRRRLGGRSRWRHTRPPPPWAPGWRSSSGPLGDAHAAGDRRGSCAVVPAPPLGVEPLVAGHHPVRPNRWTASARMRARSRRSTGPPGGWPRPSPPRFDDEAGDPGSISSGTLPRGKATTGQPESIASIITRPKGSSHWIGASRARASRSSGTFSRCRWLRER